MDEADMVIDLCTPPSDALCQVPGWEGPVGPGSTLAAVVIVNTVKVRVAELLSQQGITLPVISRACAVGGERSRALFERAYREHARRIARAIDLGANDEAVGGLPLSEPRA
jgi:uncharacterized phosphosugar-binding protein